MEIGRSLLPDSSLLQLENYHIDKLSTQIILNVSSTQALAYCPLCHQGAHRVHSHYERTLADLPWGEYHVFWQLQVRKFFCSNPDCQRRIFTERLPDLVEPWGRKTNRMAQRQTYIGLALGGAAGARLSGCLGYSTSRHTLLRLVAQISLAEGKTPLALGVDDWAYRKGRKYGTILVNLQTHQPIALLPDRESQTLTKWLKAHPGVVVISRDRSRAYEKGARLGAPKVIKLREEGWSGKAIAVKLGIGKTTVFRYLGASQFPERKRRSDRGSSLIDSYKDYFLKRWNEGCHEGKQIFQELQKIGYQGSYATVARYAKRLRKAVGIKPRQKFPSCTLKRVVDDQKLPLTVHRATWLILRRGENRDDEDEKIIEQLITQHPLLAKAIQLSQDFAQLIRERTPKQFEEWLSRALSSKLPALVAFAEGLMKDYDAVKASMTFPWSNGPVEGQINRLKMLKRQMYGRASLDLLSRRFIRTA